MRKPVLAIGNIGQNYFRPFKKCAAFVNRKVVINYEEVKSDRKEQSEHRKGRAGSRRFRSGLPPTMPKEIYFERGKTHE